MPAKKRAAIPPRSPDAPEQDQDVETWQNIGESLVHLTRIGEYGRRESELVYGGKVFAITPQERRINQSMCWDPVHDPFTNGTFKPITLLEGEADTAALRDNPNVLDDDRIAALFKLNGEAFNEKLVEITNVGSVERLIDLASRPSSSATVAQLDILKRYHKLLAGENEEPERPAGGPELDVLPKPVTPR